MSSFKCPCGSDTVVVDSRGSEFAGQLGIRRRRWCKVCSSRISTFEMECGAIANHWKHKSAVEMAIRKLDSLREALDLICCEVQQDMPK